MSCVAPAEGHIGAGFGTVWKVTKRNGEVTKFDGADMSYYTDLCCEYQEALAKDFNINISKTTSQSISPSADTSQRPTTAVNVVKTQTQSDVKGQTQFRHMSKTNTFNRPLRSTSTNKRSYGTAMR